MIHWSHTNEKQNHFLNFCLASKRRPMFGPAGGRFDRRRLDEMTMSIDVHVDRTQESASSGMETE
jgi:hypothetical protein